LAVWDSPRIPTTAEAHETVERINALFGWDVHFDQITEDGEITLEPRRRPRDVSVERCDS
jgi:spore cortex formation protein SpoVR/YcgB (stage V sporulation)